MRYCYLLVLLLGLAGCQQGPSVQDAAGHKIKLNGKLTIINYWATWCKPCKQEIPELNAFYQAHQSDKLQIVGVNFDQPESLQQLQAYIKKMGVKFPTLTQDPATMLGIKEIPGIPATFVFDAKGKLLQKLYGLQTKKSLEAAVFGGAA